VHVQLTPTVTITTPALSIPAITPAVVAFVPTCKRTRFAPPVRTTPTALVSRRSISAPTGPVRHPMALALATHIRIAMPVRLMPTARLSVPPEPPVSRISACKDCACRAPKRVAATQLQQPALSLKRAIPALSRPDAASATITISVWPPTPPLPATLPSMQLLQA